MFINQKHLEAYKGNQLSDADLAKLYDVPKGKIIKSLKDLGVYKLNQGGVIITRTKQVYQNYIPVGPKLSNHEEDLEEILEEDDELASDDGPQIYQTSVVSYRLPIEEFSSISEDIFNARRGMLTDEDIEMYRTYRINATGLAEKYFKPHEKTNRIDSGPMCKILNNLFITRCLPREDIENYHNNRVSAEFLAGKFGCSMPTIKKRLDEGKKRLAGVLHDKELPLHLQFMVDDADLDQYKIYIDSEEEDRVGVSDEMLSEKYVTDELAKKYQEEETVRLLDVIVDRSRELNALGESVTDVSSFNLVNSVAKQVGASIMPNAAEHDRLSQQIAKYEKRLGDIGDIAYARLEVMIEHLKFRKVYKYMNPPSRIQLTPEDLDSYMQNVVTLLDLAGKYGVSKQAIHLKINKKLGNIARKKRGPNQSEMPEGWKSWDRVTPDEILSM